MNLKEYHIELDQKSDLVEINYEKLKELQKSIESLIKTFKPFTWDDENFYPKNTLIDESSQFFTLGNSINFRYWQIESGKILYPRGKKGGLEVSGAMYVWRSLKVCLDQNTFDILNANQLMKLALGDVKKIFQDDDGNDVLPALDERHQNIVDLGKKLSQNWSGKSINIVKECANSLPKFVKYFKEFRAFDDPICKLIMVNAIMHEGRKITKFNQPILPGMDYQILKQLLRMRVILPSEEIIKKLTNCEMLSETESFELRKVGLFALAKIMEENGTRGDIIDNLIWGNRKKCDDTSPVCKIKGRENECPFLNFCTKKTEILIPLEMTRYY